MYSSIRVARKDYITAKYIERKYSRKRSTDNAAKLSCLCDAIKSRDIFALIQVYADGVDLTDPIPLANGHVRFNFVAQIYHFSKKENMLM